MDSPISRFRLSVNLYGAPALTLAEFAGYKQDVIVGASLQVGVPWGQYDDTRVVNIGMNRWLFKPEIGISEASGPWTLELTAGATFFTDNSDFYGGSTRAAGPYLFVPGSCDLQLPLGHLGIVDATYFTGGRTTIDGVRGNDFQQNWRLGANTGVARRLQQLGQALCEQRGVGAYRQQLRFVWRCLAVPLGRRPLNSTSGVARRLGARCAGATRHTGSP
jgi:hypothetical protein